MRRVTRRACEDGPLVEEQETEGRRQLHTLLLQQLHTGADVERCVAKRQCFAPAALYRPFGEQAAGVKSLSQFQALQDGEKELAGLREMGLTEAEIQLWQSRDAAQAHGVFVDPEAKQQRLQVIRDKMEARAELLSRPQRFAASRPLSRRQMEIERALFQGTDRLGFLTSLYHRDEGSKEHQEGPSPSDPMDPVYRAVLSCEETAPEPPACDQPEPSRSTSGQPEELPRSSSDRQEPLGPEPRPPLRLQQPIGSLRGGGGPLTVSGEIQPITDEDIRSNRESEDGIRSMARFQNYSPGAPSKVLCVKNLSRRATVAQLVALFSRFQPEGGAPVAYRLLTGRLKGQAFITLADVQTAQNALQLLHGYRLLGKPLVIEFGRERKQEK